MRLLSCLVASCALLLSQAASAEPQLLASVRPLQLIAVAVVGDPKRVDLLVDPYASHHDYQLRPSDRMRLQRADLVLWIGPELETFLRQPLAMVEAGRVLALGNGVVDTAGRHPPEHHTAETHAHGGADPDHADGHLWLDPARAIAMAEAIAERLSVLEPARRERWQRNSAQFAARLRAVDAELRSQFAAMPERRGYLVLHDAYGHFERHYDLQRTATWALTPEQTPGARHLLALQKQIDEGAIGCLFTEPGFEPKALHTLLDDARIRRRQLDLMAGSAPLATDGFIRFFEQFGHAFADCLRPGEA